MFHAHHKPLRVYYTLWIGRVMQSCSNSLTSLQSIRTRTEILTCLVAKHLYWVMLLLKGEWWVECLYSKKGGLSKSIEWWYWWCRRRNKGIQLPPCWLGASLLLDLSCPPSTSRPDYQSWNCSWIVPSVISLSPGTWLHSVPSIMGLPLMTSCLGLADLGLALLKHLPFPHSVRKISCF